MDEKLTDKEIADLWVWAFNTAGYWHRSLNTQENEKGCAMVLINRDDCEKLSKISKLSFDIGSLRAAEMKKEESSAKEPDNQSVYYECDPGKNTSCKKWMCHKEGRMKCKNPCRITRHEEFAKLDEKGKPIISASSLQSKHRKRQALSDG